MPPARRSARWPGVRTIRGLASSSWTVARLGRRARRAGRWRRRGRRRPGRGRRRRTSRRGCRRRSRGGSRRVRRRRGGSGRRRGSRPRGRTGTCGRRGCRRRRSVSQVLRRADDGELHRAGAAAVGVDAGAHAGRGGAAVVGLDLADRGEDPRVDAVALRRPVGRARRYSGGMSARSRSGRLVAALQRLEAEERAEDADEQHEPEAETARTTSSDARGRGAGCGARRRRGATAGAGTRSALQAGDEPAGRRVGELQAHGVAALAVVDQGDEVGALAADAVGLQQLEPWRGDGARRRGLAVASRSSSARSSGVAARMRRAPARGRRCRAGSRRRKRRAARLLRAMSSRARAGRRAGRSPRSVPRASRPGRSTAVDGWARHRRVRTGSRAFASRRVGRRRRGARGCAAVRGDERDGDREQPRPVAVARAAG